MFPEHHYSFQLPADAKIEPDYVDSYRAHKSQPTPATGTAILTKLQPVIERGITSYGGSNVNPMLRSHAKKLTLQAVHSYEPTKGPLKPHILNALQGLKRYATNQQQTVSVPDAVAMEHRTLTTAAAELEDQLNREPTDSELADYTGLSLKRLAYVRQYRGGLSEQQGALVSDDGGLDAGGVRDRTDPLRRNVEFIHPDLDPTNQLLVEHHLGLNGRPKLPLAAVARKLKISPGAVSQRLTSIQRMLDRLDDAHF